MIRHINDVLDVNFTEYSRRFPAFFHTDESGSRVKPVIIPAQAIAADRNCPMYFKRLIDTGTLAGDPYYLLFKANPLFGDASREKAVEFFDDFLYEKLQMPSSFDRASRMEPSDEYPLNGTMNRWEAVNAEVLPAQDDYEFRRFYEEQMALMQAEEEETRRREEEDFERKNGFRRDDPDIIDVGEPGRTGTEVGSAAQTAVGMPKQIWYGVCLHIQSGARLGYDRRSSSLSGRGRRGGYLREADATGGDAALLTAVDGKTLKDLGSVTAELWISDAEKNGCRAWSARLKNGKICGGEARSNGKDIIVGIRASSEQGLKRLGDAYGMDFNPGADGMRLVVDGINEANGVRYAAVRLISLCDSGLIQWEEAARAVIDAMPEDEIRKVASEEGWFDMNECEKCGDPACKDGEKCGLKEGEEIDEEHYEGIDNVIDALGKVKTANEEVSFEKDAIGRTVLAEKGKKAACKPKMSELDEYEPEEDGSEYYGKVMEKAAAIEDDEILEDDDIDPETIAEMVELGKKIR